MTHARDHRGQSPPAAKFLCPECGSASPLGRTACWLCGAKLAAAADADAQLKAYADTLYQQPTKPSDMELTAVKAAGVLIVVIAGLIVLAAFHEGRGAGFAALVIAAGVTYYLLRPLAGAEPSPGAGLLTRAGHVAIGVAAVVAGLVVLAAAAFIAFFVYCLYAMATQLK